ncbi:hypothetical protein [Streptomyces mirabilis]
MEKRRGSAPLAHVQAPLAHVQNGLHRTNASGTTASRVSANSSTT